MFISQFALHLHWINIKSAWFPNLFFHCEWIFVSECLFSAQPFITFRPGTAFGTIISFIWVCLWNEIGLTNCFQFVELFLEAIIQVRKKCLVLLWISVVLIFFCFPPLNLVSFTNYHQYLLASCHYFNQFLIHLSILLWLIRFKLLWNFAGTCPSWLLCRVGQNKHWGQFITEEESQNA